MELVDLASKNQADQLYARTTQIKRNSWLQFLTEVAHQNLRRIYRYLAKNDDRKKQFNKPQAFSALIINGIQIADISKKADAFAKHLTTKHLPKNFSGEINRNTPYLGLGGPPNKKTKDKIDQYINKGYWKTNTSVAL